MFPLIGSLVSAGSSLLGSYLGSQSQADIAEQNRLAQERANQANLDFARAQAATSAEQFERGYGLSIAQFGEARRQTDFANQMALANIALQNDFARMGIRWKMEDAAAAGMHPVYAAGAGGSSFSPVSVVGGMGVSPAPSPSGVGSPGIRAYEQPLSSGPWGGLSQAGQDIGRALMATATEDERLYNSAVRTLSLNKLKLENDNLRADVGAKRLKSGNPDFPAVDPYNQGQKASLSEAMDTVYNFKYKPQDLTADPRNRGQEAAAFPDVGVSTDNKGNLYISQTKDWMDRNEDVRIREWQHFNRNDLWGFLHGYDSEYGGVKAKPGEVVKVHPITGRISSRPLTWGNRLFRSLYGDR